MHIFSETLDKSKILYIGILLSILFPFSYFLIAIAQKILLQFVMFRRVDLKNMSKQESGFFQEERRVMLKNGFLWLILFQLTLEYANLVFLVLTGKKLEIWVERDIVFKILLSIYLWGFLVWYDSRRWRERLRAGKREILNHCIHYFYSFWMLIAVLFIVFQRI
jgi:hypothetical protein